MANDVRTYTIELGKVFNNGVECKNPVITVAGGQDIAIKCIDIDACLYNVQVGPGVTQPCITFLIQCEDCGACPAEEKTYCFCDSIEDCQDCEYCGSNGFCVQLCDPEDCVNGTCVGCQSDEDCTCNQVCQNGGCECPAGTTLNPVTGCCDECSSDSDCPDCDLCKTINGAKTCVPKECIDGVVKLSTCECVECNNSSDCTGEHECCNSNNECNCCPGYIRIDGVCTYVPCQFDTDCDVCEYCDPLTGCQPLDCSTGVCNPATGSCEEPCNGDCPVGKGCLNGFCVDCATLSCSGIVTECSQAAGCACNGTACEWVDCSKSNCVDWVVTDPTVIPGTPVPGTGVPAPSFTVSFTQLGIVPMSGGSGSFLDYSITVTETGGNSGMWSVEGYALGSGTSVTFKLSDSTPVQWNNVGFEVNFVGNSGQTGSIVIYNQNWFDVGNGITNDLFTTPANWIYNVQGTAVPQSYSGGSFTPGSMKLCPCGDADIIGYNWTTTEGNLTLTFTPLPDGCVRANAQGCGLGTGTITIECAGIQTELPIPTLPFDLSGANCCDPLTEENCNGTPGDGYGCTSLTVVNGEIALSNTNYVTADGYGLFRGVFQPDSIGYSIPEWIRIARTVCWSVTGTVREATSFIPPVLAHLFHDVEYRNGEGCLELGKTCDIKIAGCKKVQASACFEGCEAFDVTIKDSNPNFTASVSLGNSVQVTYAWSASNGLVGTGSSFAIPSPNTSITWVKVVATLNVNGVICVASDQIYFTLDAVQGCTNTHACNYNAGATVDDGSCISVEAPTYDCEFGFTPGATSVAVDYTPTISYVGIGSPLFGAVIATGQSLAPGTYTVGVRFDGVLMCEKELTVPVCYTCSDDTCIAAPTNANTGYNDSNCGGNCACGIVISPYFLRPDGSALAKIYVNATGGSNLHVVSIVKTGGGSIPFSNGTFAGGNPATTIDVCDGNYVITVADDTCTKTENIGVSGYYCADGDMAFGIDTRCQALGLGNGPCFDCGTNQVFYTLVGDACATSYTRKFWNNGKTITYGSVVSNGSTGQGTVSMGIYPGDGVYRLEITSNNVPPCVLETTILLDCIVPSTCLLDPDNPAVLEVVEFDDDNIKLAATFTQIGDGDTYTIEFIKLNGGNANNCTGATSETVIQTITGRPGYNGENNALSHQITRPTSRTCYKVVVTKEGDETCVTEDIISYDPNARTSGVCSLTITSPTAISTIYDTATEKVYVSWTGVDTSNDVTVKIYVSTTASCDINIDPLVINESGHGESGNGWFGPIPQIAANAQCITVVVHDTADEDCTDSIEGEIAACDCAIEVLSTDVDQIGETITVNFRTKCTSGDIDFDITGDATGSTTIADGSTDGQWVTDSVEISLTGYPTNGGAIDLEVTDDADVSCIDIESNIVLPGNCVTCPQVATFLFSDSVVTSIRDENNNLIVSGTYDLSDNSEVVALEGDTEDGLVVQGANFCTDVTGVDVGNSRAAGMGVNEDNQSVVILDHAVITNAAWVGSKKVYFGDCGCSLARTCDYTANLSIGGTDTVVDFFYGTSDEGSDYSSAITWTGMSQTPSPAFLAAMEADILNALENLAGCNFTVASVDVSYDTGTDILTIVINDTDAAIGLVAARVSSGSATYTSVEDFTQSGCV